MEQLWNDYQLEPGEFRSHRLGDVGFVVLRTAAEWQLASLPEGVSIDEQGKFKDLGKLDKWTRWEAGQSGQTYTLSPSMPKLPLMATPRAPLFIPPGASARFFLSIPLAIEVQITVNKKRFHLAHLPIQELSKTWHGSETSGEPCYSLTTNARRRLTQNLMRSDHIICPFVIKNEQSSVFQFKDLLFDPTALSLYEADGQLWSSTSRIKPAADLITAEVKVRASPPEEIQAHHPKLLKKGVDAPAHQLRRLFGSITS